MINFSPLELNPDVCSDGCLEFPDEYERWEANIQCQRQETFFPDGEFSEWAAPDRIIEGLAHSFRGLPNLRSLKINPTADIGLREFGVEFPKLHWHLVGMEGYYTMPVLMNALKLSACQNLACLIIEQEESQHALHHQVFEHDWSYGPGPKFAPFPLGAINELLAESSLVLEHIKEIHIRGFEPFENGFGMGMLEKLLDELSQCTPNLAKLIVQDNFTHDRTQFGRFTMNFTLPKSIRDLQLSHVYGDKVSFLGHMSMWRFTLRSLELRCCILEDVGWERILDELRTVTFPHLHRFTIQAFAPPYDQGPCISCLPYILGLTDVNPIKVYMDEYYERMRLEDEALASAS